MKVFLPIATTQELKIRIRRKAYNVTLSIREEATDTTTNTSLTGSYNGGFFILPFAHPFEEGNGYEITVSDDVGTVWRGKAYCTAQDPQEYKLNDGVLIA